MYFIFLLFSIINQVVNGMNYRMKVAVNIEKCVVWEFVVWEKSGSPTTYGLVEAKVDPETFCPV